MANENFTGWVSDLARDHTVALCHVARAEGLAAEDALDAVQDAFHTFLGLPQARSLVGLPSDSRALMIAIVRNAARNLRRRHYRAQPHDEVDDHPLPADLPDPESLVSAAEAHVQLLGCIRALGDVQRRVVTLRMLEEASSSDVAQELALQPGHVAVLLHRAKRDLRLCMQQ